MLRWQWAFCNTKFAKRAALNGVRLKNFCKKRGTLPAPEIPAVISTRWFNFRMGQTLQNTCAPRPPFRIVRAINNPCHHVPG